MKGAPLGRLARVDLRYVWTTEATDFTPWLAREENLAVLGEALGIELEFEAQEKAVGPFRADILCKDTASDDWVLIENQLERTDHSHLGQLLTYASGLQAVTIVWIAAKFTEEHRATLDWLNTITDESFRFFGLEIELWRIGESAIAPKFNIMSKPNNWSKSVAQAARSIEKSELSDMRLKQRDYWEKFGKVLESAGGPVSGARKAQPQSWMQYSIGRAGFSISAAMIRPKKRIRAEIYISNEHAKAYFYLLREQAEEIEQELGYPLDWEELPEGRDTRISVSLDNVDPELESDWPRQHIWLAAKVNEFHRTFYRRVRELDASSWQGQPADEGEAL